MNSPLLEVRNISKRFGGVQALDRVSMSLLQGEVLALVGENGAGKSTLMKILAGVYQPDAGEILLHGQPVSFPNVSAALQVGISLIHQELNLSENLSVAANLFLGRERLFGGLLGFLKRSQMRDEGAKLLHRVGLEPDLVDRIVGDLPPGQRQLIEIARALSLDTRILIMDEPTSSLTQKETDRLYEVIEDLTQSGVAIVYISHRLAEVKRVASRVTVLRDGKNAGELAKDEINHDNLVRKMVGRDLKQLYPRTRNQATNQLIRFEIKEVRYEQGPAHSVSFSIRAGEILGMAGLVGAGRTELAEAIFGLRPIRSGSIRLDDQARTIHNPSEAIDAGVLLVPEDRRFHGLILAESIRFNLSLPNLDRLQSLLFVNRSQERQLAETERQRLAVRCASIHQAVGQLSGGNQQKVVLGKWLARGPRLLILDEPTRGVDVGARGEIYSLIDRLAAEGMAVWMISSDLEEILGMSDRVVVLHEGRLAGELDRSQLTEEAVMRLATGGGQ